MAAVKEASREGGEKWKGLVKAGVGEALCQNVEEMCTFVHTLPGMPEHLKKQALKLVKISSGKYCWKYLAAYGATI
jgi:hypothetical protein